MCLNHLQAIPTSFLVRGKIIFHETSPLCQKGWQPLLYGTHLIHCEYVFLLGLPFLLKGDSIL